MKLDAVAEKSRKDISFSFGNKETIIKLGNHILEEELKMIPHHCTQAIVIADQHVNELWSNEVYNLLAVILPTQLYKVNAIEAEKSLSTISFILEEILKTGPSRSCAVISFGGGLTGNIAGVISGLLFRGVQLIHIPTTLLAMSDSILSQKQAVNSLFSKNSFGLYHKALLNIIDIKYLSSLSPLHIYGGIIEMVKNCLTFDPDSLPVLQNMLSATLTPQKLQSLVELGIIQKQVLLHSDPYEKEIGMVLEYGHTVGHSLEISLGNLHHGQAVGLGMLAAAYISCKRGWINDSELKTHIAMLRLCDCPLRIAADASVERIMISVRSDNKKGKIAHSNWETPMVLLKEVGKVATANNSYLVPVAYNEIEDAIRVLKTDFFEMQPWSA